MSYIGLNFYFFKTNPKIFQFMILRNKSSKDYKFKINEMYADSTKSAKLLEITVDIRPAFRKHADKIFKPASYKQIRI